MQLLNADKDNDGTLDRREFYALMCKVRETEAATATTDDDSSSSSDDCDCDEVDGVGCSVQRTSAKRRSTSSSQKRTSWLERYLEVAANAEQLTHLFALRTNGQF